MAVSTEDAVSQFAALIDKEDESIKAKFETFHQGEPTETLIRFLTAREGNVPKAHKMLIDCLNWRIKSEIDDILSKPIVPIEKYRKIRNSQLLGMSGFSKEGIPVFAIGLGLSSYDTSMTHYYVQSHIQINEYRDRVVLPAASKKYGKRIDSSIKILDMTGLKLSAMNQMKQILTTISTVDDYNYPEKTDAYFIVNAPYIFSACWRVVKPLLQERTRNKVKVLHGSGRDELLKIMDHPVLPHFCRKDGSKSSRNSASSASDNCFSLDHPFHQELYSYMKQQAGLTKDDVAVPVKLSSFHVDVPQPKQGGTKLKIVSTIESEVHKFVDENGNGVDENGNGVSESVEGLKISD
ncbi:hypothetical protein LUZ60_017113 [Juncus effusus]|nr:hypothetical protein LUZ60_017113 [Juncus effusus]